MHTTLTNTLGKHSVLEPLSKHAWKARLWMYVGVAASHQSADAVHERVSARKANLRCAFIWSLQAFQAPFSPFRMPQPARSTMSRAWSARRRGRVEGYSPPPVHCRSASLVAMKVGSSAVFRAAGCVIASANSVGPWIRSWRSCCAAFSRLMPRRPLYGSVGPN